jgi:hypothetical protein
VRKNTLITRDSWLSGSFHNDEYDFFNFDKGITYVGSLQVGTYDMFGIYFKREFKEVMTYRVLNNTLVSILSGLGGFASMMRIICFIVIYHYQ